MDMKLSMVSPLIQSNLIEVLLEHNQTGFFSLSINFNCSYLDRLCVLSHYLLILIQFWVFIYSTHIKNKQILFKNASNKKKIRKKRTSNSITEYQKKIYLKKYENVIIKNKK